MRDLTYRLQTYALRALLAVVALLPLARRRQVVGWVTRRLVLSLPGLRRRAERNLALVHPAMPEAERRALIGAIGRHVGQTLSGIWFNADLARETADLTAEGPGLETLRAAEAEGRGVLMLGAHFGDWEATRHVLKAEGFEVGALYRANNNPHYEPIHRTAIELGGRPIVPKGPEGSRVLLKHLRGGGRMAILADQALTDGVPIDFLGHPALTTLAPAKLALRYGLPLVPAFAPVVDGRPRIVVESPIPHADPETMMAEFNARLGAWVERHPEQWYWLHDRWKRYPSG